MRDREGKWWLPVLLGVGAVAGLQALYAVLLLRGLGNWGEGSAFGESFGALNAFFAGLALAGVIYTLHLQVKESRDARDENARTFGQIERQIGLLRADLELQKARDRLSHAPMFRLFDNSSSAEKLNLGLENVGAPVIVRDFRGVSGCHVQSWSPTTWAGGDKFKATCPLEHGARICKFLMEIQDRAGEVRTFGLELDLSRSPVGFQVAEKP